MILTKPKVKMAGYCPSSFFVRVFMDREKVDRARLVSNGFIIKQKDFSLIRIKSELFISKA